MTTILYYQKKLLTSIYIIVKKDIINILIQKLEIIITSRLINDFSKLFKNPLYTASVSMLIFITTHY